jgi:hypothetical protein
MVNQEPQEDSATRPSDEDTGAILSRRRFLIETLLVGTGAVVAGGLGQPQTSEAAGTKKGRARRKRHGGRRGQPSASPTAAPPQPCLRPTAAPPQMCLSPTAAPPQMCLSPKAAPPQMCLSPKAAPPQPCLSVPAAPAPCLSTPLSSG